MIGPLYCPDDDIELVYQRKGHIFKIGKDDKPVPMKNKGVWLCPKCRKEYLVVEKDETK